MYVVREYFSKSNPNIFKSDASIAGVMAWSASLMPGSLKKYSPKPGLGSFLPVVGVLPSNSYCYKAATKTT
jgi:hypothetical protein